MVPDRELVAGVICGLIRGQCHVFPKEQLLFLLTSNRHFREFNFKFVKKLTVGTECSKYVKTVRDRFFGRLRTIGWFLRNSEKHRVGFQNAFLTNHQL